MGLNEYKTNLEYGVIDTSKTGKVISWKEKPEIKANINMGCYVMEPDILKYIPKNKPYGMDDMIKKAMNKKKLVVALLQKKVLWILEIKSHTDKQVKSILKNLERKDNRND